MSLQHRDIPRVVNELDEWGNSKDPRVEHTVKARCTVCFHQWTRGAFHGWIFNKQTGIMHLQHMDYTERTWCGKDATGEAWLWRM